MSSYFPYIYKWMISKSNWIRFIKPYICMKYACTFFIKSFCDINDFSFVFELFEFFIFSPFLYYIYGRHKACPYMSLIIFLYYGSYRVRPLQHNITFLYYRWYMVQPIYTKNALCQSDIMLYGAPSRARTLDLPVMSRLL